MATVSSSTANRIFRRTQLRSVQPNPSLPSPENESNPRVVGIRVADAPATPATRVHIVDHPAAQHALTVLCNKNAGLYSVRASSNHLLVLLTLEATRSLPTRALRVETSRAPWEGVSLAKPIVLLAVSRDGLSLSHNLMECVPGLLVGSVTLNHPDGSQAPHARLHLASAPALRDCRVLLFDPVVQSGIAAGTALDLVRHLGATDISLLSYSISAQGLLRLQVASTDLNVWTAHVDSAWDGKRSPASVLGDLGTRLFA